MTYLAWGLEGTILETDSVSAGFLTPWTSLLPGFLGKKLAPDIIAVFDQSGRQLCVGSCGGKIKFPVWALVFPKRSYLPADYPHLQLWFLDDHFSPSLSFVDPDSRSSLVLVLDQIDRVLSCLNLSGEATLAINATPFSFIKDEQGRYFAGGQSVRTFHLHYLLLPSGLPKVSLDKDQIPLVYPTSFSLELFKLLLVDLSLLGNGFSVDQRGVTFDWRGSQEGLIDLLLRLDQLMYRLQLILIYSFYQDSQAFLDHLNDLVSVADLRKAPGRFDKLILVGKERNLEEINELLVRELGRLIKSYDGVFSPVSLKTLLGQLTLVGSDLASWIGKQKVILRPGMGYGALVKKISDNRFRLSVSPLDSLSPKGVMEASGFIFTKKNKVTQKPAWLDTFIKCFQTEADQPLG
ncbi:MAG: hypothetical protein ABID04_01540 [Patescibacteria group bacterium]